VRFPSAQFRAALCLILFVSAAAASPAFASDLPVIPLNGEAFYLFQSAAEGSPPEARFLRLAVIGHENVDGKDFAWWEFTLGTESGTRFGVRMLSERAPMTSRESIGRVERYLYRDPHGRVFEYLDEQSGKALLPALRFEDAFLPKVSSDARYPDGFATAGEMLGHVLIRVHPYPGLDRVSFDNPRVLVLRSDLLMASSVDPCFDVESEREGQKRYKHRACTTDEIHTLIDAGINFYPIRDDNDRWLMEEPVFFRGEPDFPDWFYRSNYFPGAMYIDEPGIRFGFNEHIPKWDLMGPEQQARALRHRVARHFISERRKVDVGWDEGNLDLHYENYPSWETFYWSAWQQMEAGAAALVYEGRYLPVGYGWHPDQHFGKEGLEDLTFEDQLNCIHGFMRGAARAFNANWGTSAYHEGDQKLYPRAFTHAYDEGAKYLWFWVHSPGDGRGIDSDTMITLGNAVKDHAKEHPRGSIRQALTAGRVGIVLPAGYIYSPGSIMGFDANQVSPGGATYSEISSTMLWEGILTSRAGIPFDFLNDEPRIYDLGYDRLVYVRPDGMLEFDPPLAEPRAAQGLDLSLAESEETPIAERADIETDYSVPRADGITIDGDLDDWDNVPWIDLGDDVRGTLQHFDVTVENVMGATGLQQIGRNYLGFTWAQLTTDLQLKYHLEDYYILGDRWIPPAPGIHEEKRGVVITSVTPESPIAKAGLREGDVIDRIHNKRTEYEFQVPEALGWFRSMPAFAWKITRSGYELVGDPKDLRAQIALAIDDKFLYVAARVTDDIFSQPGWGENFWIGDCLQIGLDPVLGRGDNGYLENDHEITFALADGRPIAWRSHGRTGQHRGEIPDVPLRIVREAGITIYEAAVPIAELMPLAPDMWPKAGFNAVVNDNDGADPWKREGRLELREGAMTRGKNGNKFAVIQFAPSPDQEKASAALFWEKRAATTKDGSFHLLMAAASPEGGDTSVVATLQSLDSPETAPVVTRLPVTLTPGPAEQILALKTQSPPGRYALTVQVEDHGGRLAFKDRLPVYIYK